MSTAAATASSVPPCLRGAPRPLSLRKNFAWTLSGNIVYSGCQWGMLIALAKLGSPAADAGLTTETRRARRRGTGILPVCVA